MYVGNGELDELDLGVGAKVESVRMNEPMQSPLFCISSTCSDPICRLYSNAGCIGSIYKRKFVRPSSQYTDLQVMVQPS